MRLSTKGRYGVRLMLDLAGSYGNGPVSLKHVAQRQEISEKYLWHLIRLLKNAGLVHSTRGAHGGYMLGKPAEQISLSDILYVLEGPMDFVECTGDPKSCKRSDDCAARALWGEVSEKIINTLASYNLKDMLDKQQSRQPGNDYSI